MRKLVCVFVCLVAAVGLVSPGPAVAQGRSGTIIGRVADESGGVLPGARVELQQAGIPAAVSDAQGEFSILNVAPGNYTLMVSYVGFAPYSDSVKVTGGQVVRVSPVLKVSSVSDSIIVTAERARGEAEAINEIRTADTILNVLPSEVIRSLPNANIADAVGRLPGVTLERDEGEGKYVQIRGTEPRLSILTIDGVEVPSPEGGVRQVKLDAVPAGLIEMVQISKTLQANMNGDAIGGAVNLVTKKAGDRPVLSLYGQGGFTPIADTVPVTEFGGTAGKRFGAQKRLGVMVSGSYDYNGRGIDDIEPVPTLLNPNTPGDLTAAFTAMAIRQYRYDRSRYGFGTSVDYRLSDTSNLYVRSLFSDFSDTGHRWEWQINDNGGSPGPNAPNPVDTERRTPNFQVASLSVGGYHAFGTTLLNWQFAAGRARMRNPIGGGESHTFFSFIPGTSNCQYDAAATTNSYLPQWTPACYTEAYDPTQFQLSQIQDSAHGKAAQVNLEGILSVAKNYHIGSHTSTFETGFYIRNAHKFDDSYEIDYCPTNQATAPLMSQFLENFTNPNYYNGHYKIGPTASWEKVNAFFAANRGLFDTTSGLCSPQTAPQTPGNNNNFDLVERVTAGYVMNSLDFSRFRLVGGVRFEGTQDNTVSCMCGTDPNNPNAGPLSVKQQGSYIDVLPSVSFRIRLDSQNNSTLRLVYARALSRPDPMFLTSAQTVDNSTTPPTVTIGNPAVKAEHAHNFDVLYERYLQPLGAIQAGFFYKKLSDPIVTLQSGPVLVPGCPPQFTSGCLVNRAANSGSAYIAGVELNFQQHFTYLPGLLSGLGISANYSYATSQATNVNPGLRIDKPALLRQAPSTFNISPTYDRGRLSARVGMAYNGANIFSYAFNACLNGENVDSHGNCIPNANDPVPDPTPGGVRGPSGDQYLYSHFQVDAQASFYLGKGLTFIASGLNLNNEVFGFYLGSPQFTFQREYYKPTYTFGFRWDLGREK